MARGINKVILVGNVGNDPDVKQTHDGSKVVRLSIATSESWKDKQTGERQERTEWHRIVFFRQLADIVSQYVKKGSKLYIEGSLRTNKWQDQQGMDRYTTEIIGNDMQMLDSRQVAGDNHFQALSAESNTPQKPIINASPEPVMHSFDDDIPL